MNTYQKGVSDALGIPANVGNPKSLFYPKDLKNGFGYEWFRRKLSTHDVATLMHVDPSTVHAWREKGWLDGSKTGTKVNGWRKIILWRHSLKDVEDCLLNMKTRKQRGNPIEHKKWTPQEIVLCQQKICPEGRSKRAYYIMRTRLRKRGIIT